MTTVKEAIDIAIQHHSAGRLSQAEEIYKQILDVEPTHPVALHLLGLIAHQLGKNDTAVALITRALDISPDLAEAHSNLGNAFLGLGRIAEAEASYRRALEIKPDFYEAQCNLGSVLISADRKVEAVSSFRRAMKLRPGVANAHSNLAKALASVGQNEEAVVVFRHALEIKPDYAEAHKNMGDALLALGQKKEAEACYRRALEIKPDFAEAHNNLGSVLHGIGQYKAAMASFRRALEIKPDFVDAHNNLGHAFLGLGQKAEALDCFRSALGIKSHAYNSLVSVHTGMADALARIVPPWHVPMMNDALRNEAYQEALRSAVTPETNVLEIGTGSGLLAMMAAQLGARQVVTCEAVPLIAATAREIIVANDYAPSIRVISKKSTDIHVGGDLPQRANLLVSEIFSSELLGEGVLSSIEDAKRRLLTTDARIIPASGSVVFALFGGEEIKKSIMVDEVCGFDLSKFNSIASQKQFIHRNDLGINLLTDDTEAFSFDFTNHDYFPNESKTLRVPIKSAGRCYGVIQWIRLQMNDSIVFENHPSIKAAASGWQLCLYRFLTPVDVVPGQTAVISVAHNRTAVWFFLENLVVSTPQRPK